MSLKNLCLLFFMVAFIPVSAYAQIPAPHLRLNFDDEFRIEGTGSATLEKFPGSDYTGIENIPAGRFVEGIVGSAFIPDSDLIIRGENVFPAPEGTVSLWIKPVRYEEDWIGGELLFPGKIGKFFTGEMADEEGRAPFSLQVRLYRHDCCSGLHWVEYWDWPAQGTRSTGPIVPFAIWQKDTWRLLTVAWSQGERRVYLNGVKIQHATSGEGSMDDYIAPAAESNNYANGVGQSTSRIERNPTIPGQSITIPSGSKAVDELTIWDRALSDSQVAALFYSRMQQSGMESAVQAVPLLSEPAWTQAVSSTAWIDSYSGMAFENKPYSDEKDILDLAHYDENLYIRYREPMPKNYIVVSTLLGAEGMLRRRVTGRNNNVWEDDSVEVRLSPDGGKTDYVLAVGAGGALYDARNGDSSFNLTEDDWKVSLDESPEYWTVEMRINLNALAGDDVPEEWGFNLVRTVRQQGYAKRQWSFNAGEDAGGLGRILLSGIGSTAVASGMEWSETTGKLTMSIQQSTSAIPLHVNYGIRPLNFLELFPGEADADARYNILDLIKATGRLDNIPDPLARSASIPARQADWQDEIDYLGTELALAHIAIEDESGNPISRRYYLISGSEAVSMRIFNLPSRRELVIQLSLASETLAGENVSAEITITGEDSGQTVVETSIQGFKSIMEEKAVDVSDIPVGPYDIDITVTKDDALLGNLNSTWFKSGDPVWLNNDIGVIKEVPAPWIPVVHGRDSISLWGREHSFKGSLLPSSMKVLDKELLAGPMRLIIKAGSESIDTATVSTPAIVVDSAGIISDLKGSAVGEKLIVDMEGEMEFDGFGYFTFTIRPADPSETVEIDSIILEVPFKKEYAQLYDDSNYDYFKTYSGLIPGEGMTVSVTDTIRVGDTERGIQFYPIMSRMGTRETDTPLSFIPGGDSVVMRHVISEGLSLNEPLQNKLGLIGTPVKPFDAKRIRMTGHAGPQIPADLQEKGYSTAKYWTAGWSNYAGGTGSEDGYYNYTPGWADGLALSRKGRWEGHRDYDALYLVPGSLTANTPEYALFWREWGGQYVEGLEKYVKDLSTYRGAETRPPGRWMSVDWTKKSWQDFYFYSLDKVLAGFARQGVKVGIYVDVTHHHGDPRPYRRWVQRLYQVGRKHSPDGLIIIHMSGDRRMPVWGMVDVLVEGEQYTANWQAYMANNPGITMNDCYPMMLPLDRMRATYTGPMWGPHQVFLSQFWTDTSQGEDLFRQENPGVQPPSYTKRFRYITGLMMVHDAPFWGEFYGCGVADNPQAPWIDRARWGYDDTVKFIPYWNTGGMLEIASPAGEEEIVVSGWLRPDGNLLLAVLNNLDEPHEVAVKLNPGNFPVTLQNFSRAVDITSPVPTLEPDASQPDVFQYTGGIVEVYMRPRDFRLLILE